MVPRVCVHGWHPLLISLRWGVVVFTTTNTRPVDSEYFLGSMKSRKDPLSIFSVLL